MAIFETAQGKSKDVNKGEVKGVRTPEVRDQKYVMGTDGVGKKKKSVNP